MPYIKPEARPEIDNVLERLDLWIKDPGNLNYFITKVVNSVWQAEPRYTTIATVTGVLENVKQEFYRRVAVPYEDGKIAENGDVY